jgi:hypothetical protein
MSKQALRKYTESFLGTHELRSMRVWDYQVDNLSRDLRLAVVTFKVKAAGIEGSRGVMFYTCHAAFGLEEDGQWRLTAFQLFAPTVDPATGEPIPFPF